METSGPMSMPAGALAVVRVEEVVVVVVGMEAAVREGVESVVVGLMQDPPLVRARHSLGTHAQARRRRRPSCPGFEAGFVMTVGGGRG